MTYNFLCIVTDCALYAVGKPVYNKFTDEAYGAWLRDPKPRDDKPDEKIWATKESNSTVLYEYANRSDYRIDKTIRTHNLKIAFTVIQYYD